MKKMSKSLKRNLIIAVAVILILAIFYCVYWVQGVLQSGLLNGVENIYVRNVAALTSDYDTADSSRFSDTNPDVGDYTKKAESESLILYLSNDNLHIKLYDKRTKKVWSSRVEDESVFANTQVVEDMRMAMQSLFVFDYIDLTNMMSEPTKAYSLNYSSNITAETITNGVRLTYQMDELSITVPLEFTIAGDSFKVTIPNDLIKENDQSLEEIKSKKNSLSGEIKAIQGQIDKLKDSISKTADAANQDAAKAFLDNTYTKLTAIKDSIGSIHFNTLNIDDVRDFMNNVVAFIPSDDNASMELYNSIMESISKILEDAEMLVSNKTIGITDLRILPYFGAGNFSTDGYVFYPDRSGAISYFNQRHPEYAGSYYQDVYDEFSPQNKIQDMDKYEAPFDKEEAYIYPTKMPVFGIKQGNSAFVSIITEGDCDAAIEYFPIISSRPYANANSVFHFRKKSMYANESGNNSFVFERKRTRNNWGLMYNFLVNDKADYSGMAVSYREYLDKNGGIKRSPIMDKKTMPLATEFFMGTKSFTQTFFDKYLRMTRFSDVEEYLATMEEKGISNHMLLLDGWSKNGWTKTPDDPKPASQIGGAKGLKSLAEYTNSKDYPLVLPIDMVWYDRSVIGVAATDMCSVKNMNFQTYTGNNGGVRMNANYVYNRYLQVENRALKKYNVNGAGLSNIGIDLYFDYNKKAVMERSQVFGIFNALMRDSKKDVKYAATYNTTALYLNQLDWNYYMPTRDSGLLYSDKAVPFYSIVMHGYIAYTGQPINYASDSKKEILEMVEFGCIPYYELTKESPVQLKKEQIGGFFSTQIANWTDKIAETYKEYGTKAEKIWNAKITRHEIRGQDQRKITYENGSVLYINYADQKVTIDGVQLEPQSYQVVNK